MTNLIKKKERNDGFAESNASPPCVGHAFMNAKPDPYESFESCNDCGESLNLGQRILNSKRVQGSKLCGRCYQKEHEAWGFTSVAELLGTGAGAGAGAGMVTVSISCWSASALGNCAEISGSPPTSATFM